jgi:hypothetical protein
VLATEARTLDTYGLPGKYLAVDFADTSNGWIYGQVTQVGATAPVPVLWATHDSGATWRQIDLAHLTMRYGVLTMSAARGVVHALGILPTGSAAIWSSPVARDDWRRTSPAPLPPPAGGGNLVAAIVLKGSAGRALFGNDRGVTGAASLTASGSWVRWTPCADVGHAFTVPVAFSATSLAAVCQIGGFGGYVHYGHMPAGARLGDQWVDTSNEGGSTFVAHNGVHFRDISPYLNFVPGTYAMPRLGVVVAWDSTHGSSVGVIARSVDWGRTWRIAKGATSLASFQSDGGVGP